ncbi:NACHT, LRR and PYD domains-containing protein 1b allele 5-like [Sinocyclocheilus rhinocerous]|uniref:NACHT, LRR and PYD domains-containing protein 1b allele 5-like n=1 Tax=Sinocyclocheilus rhinocerous TaxID=307959 RepID=UPI0007BADAC3|nr:PREDICTED: NACHT, LRR and PYD domains-containing protein 1b allele 5-like [Sinocyclocheilus rhinocerous]
MSINKTTETTSESRPPVSYLVALNDKLQMNADKVERNISETQQNLKKDIKRMNEGKQALYQEDIDRTILNSLELLNTLDQNAAEAFRLQHPQSEMIEKDMKHLRESVMKLREEHVRIYNCSATVNRGKKIDEKLDDSEWEVKRPSEDMTDANIKYSVSSSEGMHECSETSLRWRSVGDVSLEYRFADWKSLSKDTMKKYTPCGPLIDITATSGTLEEIQLPHFVCVDPTSSSDDTVKVLYVKDGTVSLERCELSGLHAKLLNPTIALFGVVANQGHPPLKYHCETLIYRNRKAPLNLHVYLIVKDQKLKKYVEEKEKNNTEIVKPTPDEGLAMDYSYTLKTSCDSKIKPQSLKLTPGKTNFFDLHIQDAKECLELSIETKEGQKIWDVNIEPDEFNTNSSASDWRLKTINRSVLILQWWRQLITAIEHSAGGPLIASLQRSRSLQSAETDTAQKKGRCKKGEGAEFVEKHRTELIRRVSLVEPIADDMKPLLGDEKYGIILQYKGVTQAQMRALLDFLTTPKLKDKLYQSLLEREGVLVEYLEGSG